MGFYNLYSISLYGLGNTSVDFIYILFRVSIYQSKFIVFLLIFISLMFSWIHIFQFNLSSKGKIIRDNVFYFRYFFIVKLDFLSRKYREIRFLHWLYILHIKFFLYTYKHFVGWFLSYLDFILSSLLFISSDWF